MSWLTPAHEAEYLAFCAEYQPRIPVVTEEIARLGGSGGIRGDQRASELSATVRAALELGTPLSVTRYGDGEGSLMFLDMYGEAYPLLAGVLTNRIMRLMFGPNTIAPADAREIAASVMDAFAESNVVGVPVPGRELHAGELPDAPAALANPSTLAVTLGSASTLAALVDGAPRQPSAVVWAKVQRTLLPFYGDILRSARRITLVTSLSRLPSVVRETFGVDVPRVISIPGQAANIESVPDAHWPSHYRRVLSELAAEDRAGELVIVAAGILGKHYTIAAAEAGAVAIDIGSMAEAWMGESVRPYQSEAYLAEVAAVLGTSTPASSGKTTAGVADGPLSEVPLGPEFLDTVLSLRPAFSLEIGAYEAGFSRALVQRLPDVVAVACEANPDVHAHFVDEVRAAGVDYRHVAVSDAAGTVALNVPRSIATPGGGSRDLSSIPRISSLLSLTSGWRAREDVVTVPSTTLAALVEECSAGGGRGVAWIDVEGATGKVLSGVGSALDRIDAIHVELDKATAWHGQWRDVEVVEFLEAHGFSLDRQEQQGANQYNAVFLRRPTTAVDTHAPQDGIGEASTTSVVQDEPLPLRVGWDERSSDRLLSTVDGVSINLAAFLEDSGADFRSLVQELLQSDTPMYAPIAHVLGLDADLRAALDRGHRLGADGHRRVRELLQVWTVNARRSDRPLPWRGMRLPPLLEDGVTWPAGLYCRFGVAETRMLESYLANPGGVMEAAVRVKEQAERGDDLRAVPRSGGWLNHDDLDYNVIRLMTQAGFYFGADGVEDLEDWCLRYFGALGATTNLLPMFGALPQYFGIQEKLADRRPLPTYVGFPGLPSFYASLEGQRVLLVSAFADLITEQHASGRLFRLYENVTIPEFDVRTIPAPMSIYPNRPGESWSRSFALTCQQIDEAVQEWQPTLFLASAGGYGLPLTHYAWSEHGVTGAYPGHAMNALFGIRSKGSPLHPRWRRADAMWRDSNLGAVAGLDAVDGGRYTAGESTNST